VDGSEVAISTINGFALNVAELSCVPSGPYRYNVPLLIELLISSRIGFPAVPSKRTKPVGLTAVTPKLVLPPMEMRLVKFTLETGYGDGTTTKSLALVACPEAVCTEIFPDPDCKGTPVLMVVAVAEYTGATTPLNLTVLLDGTGLKFVPVIVTGVSSDPIVGVKLEIVGAPAVGATVNDALLVALPEGDVTLIVPVVAEAGTVAVI
jgi:hypothetical protein